VRDTPDPVSRSLALHCVVLAGALMLGPGMGLADEIYRWVDAQGNVHFGSQPPTHGRQVRELEEQQGSAAINIVPGVDRPAPKRRQGTSGSRAEPTRASRLLESVEEPLYIGGRSRDSWRDEASRLESRVAKVESDLDRAKDSTSEVVTVWQSRRLERYIARLEKDLELAEQNLEAFRDRARTAGVPPGWLR